MAQIIQGVPAPAADQRPIAYFVVGHSASGKSTFIHKFLLPEERGAFFYINPDVLGQFFCGSYKTFVDMKKRNLMSGDTADLDSAHEDLNELRKTFISNETMEQGKHAVLDSNTVPPFAVDAWRKKNYEVRVAFVEASYSAGTAVVDEVRKIALKVKHGLKNDENRVRNGEHSNRSIITDQRLVLCRKEAARLHTELKIDVYVYISSGNPSKGQEGYMRLGKIGDPGLDLDDEYGFVTSKETSDDQWHTHF
jgi:hypothetical protein